MRANHVRRRLATGEPSIGTWLSLPSPEAAEYVSRLGFDWLVVDTEHNPVDIRTLAQMFAAMAASTTAPMVRIPWNSPENFKRVLDAGAWGVVVPMVNSREEAEQAVSAARYFPDGTRSVGGGRFPMSFDTGAEEYFRNANDQVLVVLQIEHIRGVENADAILSVPGVDACFIGPNDLALGCGHGRSTYRDSVDVEHLIQHIITTCRAAGVVAGLHCSDAEMAVHWAGRGARLLTVGHDTSLLRAAAAQTWSTLESSVGVAARRGTGENTRPGGQGD